MGETNAYVTSVGKPIRKRPVGISENVRKDGNAADRMCERRWM